MEHVVKARIEAWSNSRSVILRGLARAVIALGSARRFVRNPRIRSEQLTRILNRGAHLQGATYTEPNRYPELFAACAFSLRHLPSPSILSFGCATGEEAFSLAELLPNATIIGVDLNRWCVAQARKAYGNPRIRFLHAASREFAGLTPFDAIFAMAVFQRTENRTKPASVAHGSFTFAKFEQEIASLNAKLKPGGLFFLDHADFRFEDTTVAAHYTPLAFAGSQFVHDRPLFGRDNQLLATHYPMQRAFRKHAS